MLWFIWLMHMIRNGLQNQRRNWMLFLQMSHWRKYLSLYWETRLTYLMLHRRRSCVTTWD
ncbi:hypothetical protein Ahy_B04g070156 isoform D [Arachis hypogaea]|uniref:Uncharacterized protein n=1 Tax=Arachis hypogaea TaxID=3818 RepID=A0A444ZF63_ARAHY|nr:hypothetical protein Ahy_B04g070156 isoform D [Arachis hypogaea]